MARALVEASFKMLREKEMALVMDRAMDEAEERVLDALLPPARGDDVNDDRDSNATKQLFRKLSLIHI